MEDWDAKARLIGFADEASMLHYFYVVEVLPIADIALKLSVGPATISHRLDKARINKRTRGGANNVQRISKRLHRMDQREVFQTKDTDLAKRLGAHPSTVYKYKREVKGVYKPWSSAISVPPVVSSDGGPH